MFIRVMLCVCACVFIDVMVMDEKVKESFVLDTVFVVCSYDVYYKDYFKYWCRGYFRIIVVLSFLYLIVLIAWF